MKILVWKGKHSTEYYDARDDETLAKSALALMHQFNDYELYYYEPEDPRLSKYHPVYDAEDLTDEQIEGLPTEGLREEAKKARSKYRGAMKAYARDHAMWEEGQRILREEDASVKHEPFVTSQGKKKVRKIIPAWDFINARADYEYEYVRIETLHTND